MRVIEELYTVKVRCDVCDETVDEAGPVFSKWLAIGRLEQKGWIIRKDGEICPECWDKGDVVQK